VRAQHDDLARAGVAADADLRVELGVALGFAMSTMTRIGCSREASLAASIASRAGRGSSR
jgi:hypothetical protein